MKVFLVYDKLDRKGGVQTILFNLFHSLSIKGVDCFILSPIPFSNYIDRNRVPPVSYLQLGFKALRHLRGSLIFSHSRKTTTLLIILKRILGLDCEIVHVAHSVFHSKNMFTLFPDRVIAVSHAVKRNLEEYFRVRNDRIRVIYNGLEDVIGEVSLPSYQPDKQIRILHAGRIVPVKRQVEIVHRLAKKLKQNIKIDFAGEGSDGDRLKAAIENSGCSNFSYLGYQDCIPRLTEKYHYVLLFSEKEGLGLSLVEGCMAGRPLITRGVNGCEACSEVCSDGYNGFIINDFEHLAQQLSGLDEISCDEYFKLCSNSRKLFEERFLITSMVESYVSEIQSMAPILVRYPSRR